MGIIVLKPDRIEKIENKEDPKFVKFQGEENKSKDELRQEYYDAIAECDAHIIFNKDSYFGRSALFELLVATACRKIGSDNPRPLPKTYLLEKPDLALLNKYSNGEDFADELELCNILNEFIEEGILGVGIDQMLDDFDIAHNEVGFK